MSSGTQSPQPLVSVVIPVYKVEGYLDQCVQSVVGQTYGNLEIILVDDGSPDDCGRMCDRWAQRDPRIRVLHKENGGLSDARNHGLAHATGDYVDFVDSDDVMEPQLIEHAVAAALDHDADVVVFQFRFLHDDGTLTADTGADAFPAGSACTPREALAYMWDDRVQNFSWSVFARRGLYDTVRFPKGRLVEDMATTYRIVAGARRIYFLGEELYRYRVREGSILSHMNPRICADMAANIAEISRFSSREYPDMEPLERNWAIRYLTTDVLWLYGLRGRIPADEYRTMRRRLIGQIDGAARDIGWRRVSNHNRMKVAAIRLHLMPLYLRISQRRSSRNR